MYSADKAEKSDLCALVEIGIYCMSFLLEAGDCSLIQ